MGFQVPGEAERDEVFCFCTKKGGKRRLFERGAVREKWESGIGTWAYSLSCEAGRCPRYSGRESSR